MRGPREVVKGLAAAVPVVELRDEPGTVLKPFQSGKGRIIEYRKLEVIHND